MFLKDKKDNIAPDKPEYRSCAAKLKKKAPLMKPEYLGCANKLSEMIQSNKDIFHTPFQITLWAKPIRQLVEQNKVSLDRVNPALDWYADHIGEKYVPEIWSGSSLRSKFLKLESAMSRNTGDYTSPKKPKNIPHDTTEHFRWDVIPTAQEFIQQYIEWLEDQNWIEEINANLFLHTHKIFRKFLRQQQKRLGLDFFTASQIG
jgi:hypothetical protein